MKILNSLKKLFVTFCAFSCLMLSLPTLHAATQGTEGNNSTGTVDVNVSIGRLVRIQGLRDFNFGTWASGDGTLTDNDDVCIANNFLLGSYGIRAAGDGDGVNGIDPSSFTLSNGVDQISYNVFWNDETGTAGNQQLTGGVIARSQTGTFGSFLFNFFGFCVNNANIQVTIPATELEATGAGNYTGTLTLLIIPD